MKTQTVASRRALGHCGWRRGVVGGRAGAVAASAAGAASLGGPDSGGAGHAALKRSRSTVPALKASPFKP
jgi:hypothetical protein